MDTGDFRPLADLGDTLLIWEQPDAQRAEYELTAEGERYARLLVDHRNRAQAIHADGNWSFRPAGFQRVDVMLSLGEAGPTAPLGEWQQSQFSMAGINQGTLTLTSGGEYAWIYRELWLEALWSVDDDLPLVRFHYEANTLGPARGIWKWFGVGSTGPPALIGRGRHMTVELSRWGRTHPDRMLFVVLGRYLVELAAREPSPG